ncbi:uncharacterized protein LOC112178046 [Rosa chinensis]|uniref:uncharacterized protein LOC112178046 n=1 Tax=Rosa chinensis TaxID=74649 RepID=UPI000D09084B|nr:uncharacterized protein LOC112178046 [Rosa chinensis]
MICFECGCFGHVKDKCPTTKNVNSPMHDSSENQNSQQKHVPANDTISISSGHQDMETNISNLPCLEASIDKKDMDPWMLMTYKNKRKSSSGSGGSGKAQGGSRFNVLQEVFDEDTTNQEESTPDASTKSTTPTIVKLSNNFQTKTKQAHVADNRRTEGDNDKKKQVATNNIDTKQDNTKKKQVAVDNGKSTIDNQSYRVPTKDVCNRDSHHKPLNPRSNSKSAMQYQRKSKPLSINVPQLQIPNFKYTNLVHRENAKVATNIPATFGHCPPEEPMVCERDTSSVVDDVATTSFVEQVFATNGALPQDHSLPPQSGDGMVPDN